MSFQRARTDNQKDIRVTEILSATTQLYNTIGYENITLSNIARELSFSRVNLYKYFKTKEEIFLKMLLNDITDFTQDILAKLETTVDMTIDNFASIFTNTIYDHKRLLHLLTLDLCVMEKNVTEEKLLEHKISTIAQIDNITNAITTYFPQISNEQAIMLINNIIFYSRGLYPATHKNEVQEKIYAELNSSALSPDYISYMKNFIIMNLGSMINQS